MMRAAMLAALIVGIAMQPAAAEPFYREDLRIPMEAAGPRGLEAMLLRPSGTRRYPLALISHGAPREGSARAPMSPYGSYRQALEFARRGFAALVFMRRGYGDSGGQYAENSGPCGQREYLRAAWQSASDLRAAVEAMGSRTDVSTNGMIAVGVSAGGFASLALSADPPPGLAAAINFAGGRGSRADNDVCDADALVRAFATLGRTSRVPTLWIYAQNDKFFGPELVRRMHTAFTGASGRANSSMSRHSAMTAIRCFRAGYRCGRRWSTAFCATKTSERAISRQCRRRRQYHRRRNCATRGAQDFPIIFPPARTGRSRFRQRELSLTAAGAARRGKRRRLPSPPVRGTRPIANYMQSTTISPTPPDRAEGFSGLQACRSGVDTTRPSRSSLTLIWHDRREFGRTSKPKSSMSSSIGVGAPTFSRQASST
jgi:dienelactone hydrolase